MTPLPTYIQDLTLDIEKFIYDGSERYCELAHSFFHFCYWNSQGREMVTDLQGVTRPDGSLVLIDPVVLR